MECVLDLHAKMVNEREEDGFGSLGEDEKLVAVSEREIWLDDATNHQDDDDLLEYGWWESSFLGTCCSG
uniref:ABI3-like factor n=1 Tax=Pisum sativum TaxID=3888 RepID=B4XEV8_PEA|nr:ABI3-like factor [Pisum sativum]